MISSTFRSKALKREIDSVHSKNELIGNFITDHHKNNCLFQNLMNNLEQTNQ